MLFDSGNQRPGVRSTFYATTFKLFLNFALKIIKTFFLDFEKKETINQKALKVVGGLERETSRKKKKRSSVCVCVLG